MSHYLSKNESVSILKQNYLGKLGYIAEDCPFIVPITYFYDENHIMAFSKEGHKINGMRLNNKVCLYVDEIVAVKKWKSILIHGIYEEVDKFDQQFYLNKLGQELNLLLGSNTPKPVKSMDAFSNMKQSKNEPVVYRIAIWDITGRYMK